MASAAGTRRFRARFRRDKFPNPEQSVGQYLQKLLNDLQVWDAAGPALDMFDRLSLEITEHLNKFGAAVEIKDEVRWTLCMVGKTEATTRPTVVFLSPDACSRQAVKEQIKSSGLLKGYPGFITMDCNRPPGCAEMILLGGSTEKTAFTSDISDTLDSDSSHQSVYQGPTSLQARDDGGLGSTPMISSCKHVTPKYTRGANRAVVISVGPSGISNGKKRAVAGGCLRHGEHFYVMTVAHIFPGHAQNIFPAATSPDFEYEIDSWSDDEDMDMDMDMGTDIDDHELDLMREASMSTPGSDSDDAQFWNISQSDPAPKELEGKNDGDSSEVSTLTRRRNPQSPAQKAVHVEHTGNHDVSDHPVVLNIYMEMRDGCLESIRLKPILLSLDSKDIFLDYALLPISSAQLDSLMDTQDHQHPSQVLGSLSATTAIKLRKTVDVVAKTASGGNTSGKLLGTPTFMKRARSKHYQELWTVTMQKHLEKGDSGSWIYDAKTGEVYGHLIAGSPGAGFGYVMPMVNVLEDLRERFPGTWEVFKSKTDYSIADELLFRDFLATTANNGSFYEDRKNEDDTLIVQRSEFPSPTTQTNHRNPLGINPSQDPVPQNSMLHTWLQTFEPQELISCGFSSKQLPIHSHDLQDLSSTWHENDQKVLENQCVERGIQEMSEKLREFDKM